MRLKVCNRSFDAVQLYYDRHGPEGGLELAPTASVTITVMREDTTENPVELSIHNGHLALVESAIVTTLSGQEPAEPITPYDQYGRLADAAEWQKEFLLGLHDLLSDANEAGFSPNLIDELKRLRLRFIDEFEARFPGSDGGRALWR